MFFSENHHESFKSQTDWMGHVAVSRDSTSARLGSPKMENQMELTHISGQLIYNTGVHTFQLQKIWKITDPGELKHTRWGLGP